jgi:EAL domain-containing protein (putative c-di-GMP-specific phosphodiesterase class I)/LysM repeat protein
MISVSMKTLMFAVLVVAGLAAACSQPNAPTSQSAAPSTEARLHVVAPGESFEQIAARYGVTLDALLAANTATIDEPLNTGRPLTIPPSQPGSAPPAVASPPIEGQPAEPVEPAIVAPKPLSREWRDAQIVRARALVEDIRAREGGTFFLVGAALVGGFLALQVLIWLVRELVLTFAPLVRKLGSIGHDLGLNVWYAAWWIGLLVWVPARTLWRFVGPAIAPRARVLGRFALEHGTVWSRSGARWLQAQGKRAAVAVRDEAIDSLEELALNRPSLRGVSEKVQEIAYKDSRAMRSRLPSAPAEAWPPSEQELLEALAGGTLSVQFAPLLDMTAVTVAALESSLNWDRGAAGSIPGARLSAALERPGYTRIQRALLERVLREACSHLVTSGEGTQAVAVPLGRAQFFDPTLFTTLRSALQDSGADPSRLELGIEERAVLSDLPAAGEVLTRLRETGVQINLRDFGALTAEQLRSLSVSAVTVDFWNSRHDERIEAYVAESVRAAREAGLPVTASRAETPDELEFARSLGCERLASASPTPQQATPEPDEPDDSGVRSASTAAA